MDWELEKLTDAQLVRLLKIVSDIETKWSDGLTFYITIELAKRAVKQLGLETN